MLTDNLLSPGGRPAPGSDAAKRIRDAAERIIYIAIRTMAVQSKPQPLGHCSSMPEPVIRWKDLDHEARLELKPKVWRKPTARDLTVMEAVYALEKGKPIEHCWLYWLEEYGGFTRKQIKIIEARAFDVPWWRLADRFGKHIKTVQRWHDAMIDKLARRFWREIDALA